MKRLNAFPKLKKGGSSFKVHRMYDPVSSESVIAYTEEDHNRYKSMGFIHEDELKKQLGGDLKNKANTLLSGVKNELFATNPSVARQNEENPGLVGLNNFVNSIALNTQRSMLDGAADKSMQQMFNEGGGIDPHAHPHNTPTDPPFISKEDYDAEQYEKIMAGNTALQSQYNTDNTAYQQYLTDQSQFDESNTAYNNDLSAYNQQKNNSDDYPTRFGGIGWRSGLDKEFNDTSKFRPLDETELGTFNANMVKRGSPGYQNAEYNTPYIPNSAVYVPNDYKDDGTGIPGFYGGMYSAAQAPTAPGQAPTAVNQPTEPNYQDASAYAPEQQLEKLNVIKPGLLNTGPAGEIEYGDYDSQEELERPEYSNYQGVEQVKDRFNPKRGRNHYKDRQRLSAKIAQGVTGYDGEKMQAEIDAADNEGRRINFEGMGSGAVSNNKFRKQYNEEYDQYEADLNQRSHDENMVTGYMNMMKGNSYNDNDAVSIENQYGGVPYYNVGGNFGYAGAQNFGAYNQANTAALNAGAQGVADLAGFGKAFTKGMVSSYLDPNMTTKVKTRGVNFGDKLDVLGKNLREAPKNMWSKVKAPFQELNTFKSGQQSNYMNDFNQNLTDAGIDYNDEDAVNAYIGNKSAVEINDLFGGMLNNGTNKQYGGSNMTYREYVDGGSTTNPNMSEACPKGKMYSQLTGKCEPIANLKQIYHDAAYTARNAKSGVKEYRPGMNLTYNSEMQKAFQDYTKSLEGEGDYLESLGQGVYHVGSQAVEGVKRMFDFQDGGSNMTYEEYVHGGSHPNNPLQANIDRLINVPRGASRPNNNFVNSIIPNVRNMVNRQGPRTPYRDGVQPMTKNEKWRYLGQKASENDPNYDPETDPILIADEQLRQDFAARQASNVGTQQSKVQRSGVVKGKAAAKADPVDPYTDGEDLTTRLPVKKVEAVKLDENGNITVDESGGAEGKGKGRGNSVNPNAPEIVDNSEEGNELYLPNQVFRLNPRFIGNSTVDGVMNNPYGAIAYNPNESKLSSFKHKEGMFGGNKTVMKFNHGNVDLRSPGKIRRQEKRADRRADEELNPNDFEISDTNSIPSWLTEPYDPKNFPGKDVPVEINRPAGPRIINAEPYVVGDDMSTNSPNYVASINPSYAQVDQYSNPTLQNPMQGQEPIPFNYTQLQNNTMMDANRMYGGPSINPENMNYDYFNRGGVPSRRDNRQFAQEQIEGRDRFSRQDRRRLRRDLNKGRETQEGYMQYQDQEPAYEQAPMVREDNSFQQNISPMPLIDPGMVTMSERPEMVMQGTNAGVTDDMSFGQAFGTANKALGENGTFMWRGKKYGTRRDPNWRGKKEEEIGANTGEVVKPTANGISDVESTPLEKATSVPRKKLASKAKTREEMESAFIADAKARNHIPENARIGRRQDGTAYVNIDGQNREIKSNDGKTWMLTPEGTNSPIYNKRYNYSNNEVANFNYDPTQDNKKVEAERVNALPQNASADFSTMSEDKKSWNLESDSAALLDDMISENSRNKNKGNSQLGYGSENILQIMNRIDALVNSGDMYDYDKTNPSNDLRVGNRDKYLKLMKIVQEFMPAGTTSSRKFPYDQAANALRNNSSDYEEPQSNPHDTNLSELPSSQVVSRNNPDGSITYWPSNQPGGYYAQTYYPDGTVKYAHDPKFPEGERREYAGPTRKQQIGGPVYMSGGSNGNMYGQGISGYYGNGGANMYGNGGGNYYNNGGQNMGGATMDMFPQQQQRRIVRMQGGGSDMVSIHQNELAKLQQMAQMGQQAMQSNEMYNAMNNGTNPMG